jgi:ATP-dependent RNA helicase DDX18/HAS1
LQKNYFLHQSARDGYRSYLQSYASYSLKKIFNVDALDLAKVAKSFGFAVPPRVNVNIGGGTGGTGRSGKKRKHEGGDEEDEVDIEEIEVNEDELDNEEEESRGASVRGRGDNSQSRNKRAETLGRKRTEKEVFRKGMQRKRQKGLQQWCR